LQPPDPRMRAASYAIVDRSTFVIGHELPVRAALLFLAIAGSGSARHRHAASGQQVQRFAIKWMLVTITLVAHAINDRLVIAGDETVRRAERRDANWAEVLLEEGAR